MKSFFKLMALGLIAATPTAVRAEITLVNTTPQRVTVSVLRGKIEVEPNARMAFKKPLNPTIKINETVIKTADCIPNSTYNIVATKGGYLLKMGNPLLKDIKKVGKDIKIKIDRTLKGMTKPSEPKVTDKTIQADTSTLQLTNKTGVAMRVVKASNKKGYKYLNHQVLFPLKANESITIPANILNEKDAGLEFDSTAYLVRFFSEFKMTPGSYNVIMGSRTDGSATFKEVRVERATEESSAFPFDMGLFPANEAAPVSIDEKVIELKNDTQSDMVFTNKNGQTVDTINPGKTIKVSLRYVDEMNINFANLACSALSNFSLFICPGDTVATPNIYSITLTPTPAEMLKTQPPFQINAKKTN